MTIPRRGTYERLRQVARLYFAEQDTMPDWKLVEKIANQLELTQAKVWELVYLAYAFRYSISIEMEVACDAFGQELPDQYIQDMLPPSTSAEAEYANMVLDAEIGQALRLLDERDIKLLEMYTGLCLGCFRNLERLKYSEIAKELGYPSANSVAKKKAAIMKKLRDKLTDSKEFIPWEW